MTHWWSDLCSLDTPSQPSYSRRTPGDRDHTDWVMSAATSNVTWSAYTLWPFLYGILHIPDWSACLPLLHEHMKCGLVEKIEM